MRTLIISLLILSHSALVLQANVDERIELVSVDIENDPDNAGLYVKRARLHLENNDLKNAGLDLESAKVVEGDQFPPFLITYAELQFQAGNLADANIYIDEFLDIKRIHVGAFKLKAKILEALGDNGRAIDFYKKAVVHKSNDKTENYLALIDLLEKQGRYVEAIFYCKAAIRSTSDELALNDRLAGLKQLQAEQAK